MFVDRAVVTFKAGKGGDGCASFRREKFIPKGGPDGGDGGVGADIVLRSSENCHSLVDFKFRSIVQSEKGLNGSSRNKTGRSGTSEILEVPAGTLIKTFPEERIIFDFTEPGMEFVIAAGGAPGKGNAKFKSSVNRTPTRASRGKPGEVIKVVLELKLIAYAGLVGFPNAGKSTLISRVSGAKPKIADYAFTTLVPNLGVVYDEYNSLVLADIPGIIEGAHKGEGMGTAFLRHIERNRLLVYVVDLSPYTEMPPLETFKILRNEVKSHNSVLGSKKFFVVGNKIDLLNEEAEENRDALSRYCSENGITYVEISAAKELNLIKFKKELFRYYNESS